MRNHFFVLYLLLFFSFFSMTLQAQSSYFPLKKGSKWVYSMTDYATSDLMRTNSKDMLSGKHQREIWGTQEGTVTVMGDSSVNGRRYQILSNSAYPEWKQLVREENGNFFRFNPTTFKDQNFLKANLTQDDIWLDFENAEETMVTVYVVVEIAKEKVFKGKVYRNVIGIGAMTVPSTDIVNVVQSPNELPIAYYAQGVGLVYQYAPYPFSMTYSDLEMSLTGYSVQ